MCGYWQWTHHVTKKREKAKPSVRRPDTDKKGSVTIPYVPGVTEGLQRLFRKHGVQAHAKPFNTIRSMVVAPKDKTKAMERCDTVYHISCADCPVTYTGETGQPLAARLKQHKRESSVVGRHIKSTGHTIDWNNTKVLDRDSNWTRRGVKEAINIRRHRPSLNLDQGRHQLPASFDKLVSQHHCLSNSGVGDTNTAS